MLSSLYCVVSVDFVKILIDDIILMQLELVNQS